MKRVGIIVLAMATGGLTQALAGGAEYCVECTSPGAVYRCAAEASGLGASPPRMQLLCATELSRLGGHESCSVRRQTSGVCDGPLKTIAVPAADVGPAPSPAAAAAGAERNPVQSSRPVVPAAPVTAAMSTAGSVAAGSGSEQRATAMPPGNGEAGQSAVLSDPAATQPPLPPSAQPQRADGPPATVEEAAKALVDSSEKGLQKAGNAVSETTQNTAGAVSGTAKSAGKMVVDGAKSAGQAVGTAGAAVGNAAKKSWNCVASLFSEC